jgi:hypothetical protein
MKIDLKFARHFEKMNAAAVLHAKKCNFVMAMMMRF